MKSSKDVGSGREFLNRDAGNAQSFTFHCRWIPDSASIQKRNVPSNCGPRLLRLMLPSKRVRPKSRSTSL